MLRRFCVVSCGLLLAHPLQAQPMWSGKGEVGLVLASGNNETKTVNGKINVVRESGRSKNALGSTVLYASDANEDTARRWNIFGQSDYSLTPKVFYFGAVRYEDDAFSGFEYQTTLSSGFGRRFIDTQSTRLSATAGVGYQISQSEPVFDDAGMVAKGRDTDRRAVLRSTLDFQSELTGTTQLLNKFVSEAGAENTFIQNELSLQVRMNDVLALAVGYTIRQNTNPPGDAKKVDTLTTINLVVEIK
jgi:putative salt-induced outer membrane protein